MEPSATEPDLSGLRSTGLSAEQIEAVRAMLAELGTEFRVGLAACELPAEPPDFFAIGSEMPAARFGHPSPRLRHYLKPKGRPTKSTVSFRPQQADVNTWMMGRAASAFAQHEPALKETTVVPECMAATKASRTQARVAFAVLPRELRRQRGQHDRWVVTTSPTRNRLAAAAVRNLQ
jgi:hypothetical protein